jgi:penicillin G amidase
MSVIASLPEVRRRNPALRILYYAVCLLLAAVIIGLWWLYWIARSPLPQLDGTARVHGVSAKVRVLRDEHGVPTIEAATLDDLFFAQGYVTAQDRLWQMDLMRRAAAGELSEIIGEDAVEMDREERILGLRGAAEAAEKALSARDRAYFEDYARGANAFLESHRNRLSLEFRLLKYQPRPWTPTDSLLVGARLVKYLNHYNYARAIEREKILAKLGPELTADLYVNSSWRDRPPTDLRRGMAEEPAAGNGDEDDEDDEEVDPAGETNHLISALTAAGLASAGFKAAEDDPFRPGSNNWVVSGQHTVTGKPLLSNDMHLDHQMPNLWFEAHLKSGDFDVAGVTLPGVPFVFVGHNQRIGWGFTNVGPTVEDDYIEEFNERGQYKTPAGWRDPERRQEVIHVKGKPDVTLEVVTTRHGPIISELIPGETRKIALRWTLYGGVGVPFFDVNSATNWDEFRKAFSTLAAGGQNVMYADVDGHIGYQATGRVPIRAAGDGSLPVAGSDDAHEWKGYIPFDELPRVFDPPTGILASANGRIAPDKYKYSISTEWDAPWRTDRIYRVLESGKKFAPADMLALQMDVSSTYDRFCADKFVYALDHAANISSRAKQAADILRDWDGRMSADSAAPTIETKSRAELVRLLLEPKLGPAPEGRPRGELSWKSYRWSMSTVWLETVLTKQPARWLPPGYPDYQSLLTAAVENALKRPGMPADFGEWKWGKNYPVEIKHLVLSRLPLIARWTGPGVHPLSGSAQTVKAVSRRHGASERATWNFANFDDSTLNIVTGESGIFLSPYYMDQWRAWYGGSTFAFPFSQEAVETHKKHEMTLE